MLWPPLTPKAFVMDIKAIDAENLYTYCASCMGQFYRNGFREIKHVLPAVTGTEESPDTMKSYVNRVLTRFR